MIKSWLAFVIYTFTTLAVLVYAHERGMSVQLAIAFFTQYTIGFVAYIARRYYKHKLNGGDPEDVDR